MFIQQEEKRSHIIRENNKMMSKYIGLIASLALTACASTPVEHEAPLITYAPVQLAYDNYTDEMQKQRLTLAFKGGASVNNCRSYLAARQTLNIRESDANFIAAQTYLICDTIAAVKASLASSKPTPLSLLKEGGITLAQYADLRSFSSSYYRQASDEKFTLDALFHGEIKFIANATKRDNDDWFYELRIVARIDLNNNGKEDWLIWLTDKAKKGSYNTVSILVAYDVNKANGTMKLVPLMKK